MSWTLLFGLALALTLAVLVAAYRRVELERLEQSLCEFAAAREQGTRKARLSYPHVDLSRCLGCGACIRACPEEGVLGLIHGQALVVHGARCVGHGACARECPTGAIALTIGELETRRDIPALDPTLEVPGVPGLFLGGEVTGYALIRTAIAHGTAIADEVARRLVARTTVGVGRGAARVFDLCIVGAGPAGLAMALEAKARGLSFLVLEQDTLGGTVAKYPRAKLVMTQPVELPLVGRLERTTYSKEELMELWQRVAREQQLPIHEGVHFQGLARGAGGSFEVHSSRGRLHARFVALALGRRGTPRRLEVPGEELPKVIYGLLDARAHQGKRILVVGGGDSAVEAALALAEQPGNEVTLSYRQAAFTRLKARNEERIESARSEGRVRVLLQSQVLRITADAVELGLADQGGARSGWLPNDEAIFGLEQHARAAFPLEASHRAVACSSCHEADPPGSPRVFRGTPGACAECHADAHHGAFDAPLLAAGAPRDCARCHAPTSFAEYDEEAFQHGPWTGFELDGAHAHAECTACHQPGEGPDEAGRTFGVIAAVFGEPAERCVTCHVDAHDGHFDREGLPREVAGATDCARCHSSETFAELPRAFEHERWTGYPMADFHAEVECAACHLPAPVPDEAGRTFGRAPERCADCHADPHVGQFAVRGATDCARCHQDSGPNAFDHQRDSRYALDEVHVKLACAACHLPWPLPGGGEAVRYKPLGTECVDCHDPDFVERARRSQRGSKGSGVGITPRKGLR